MVDRGLYQHHGIYIGEDNVVHWRGELGALIFQEDPPVIEVDKLAIFRNWDTVIVIEYDEEIDVLETVEVVHRALSRRGESGYNILGNNCEHFAIWCKTGIHESTQVNEVITRIGQWIGRVLDGNT